MEETLNNTVKYDESGRNLALINNVNPEFDPRLLGMLPASPPTTTSEATATVAVTNKISGNIPVDSSLAISNNVNSVFDPDRHSRTTDPSSNVPAVTTTTPLGMPSGSSSMASLELNTTANKTHLWSSSSIFSSTSIGLKNVSVRSTFPTQTLYQRNSTTGSVKPPVIYDGSPYPIFCGSNTDYECLNTPLSSCQACDMGGAALMATLVLLLGIAIVLGNSLILVVMGLKKKKRKLENMDLHRSSLAVADLLTGLQILVIFSFNFGRSFSSTSAQNHARYFEYRDSKEAAVGGVFFLLPYTSSMYNLVYLAGQMLYAFVRPFQYKMQRKRTVTLGLSIVWLLAIISSTVLVWYPKDYAPAYVPSTFLFFYETRKTATKAVSISLLIISYLLPFLLTIILLTTSALIMNFTVRKSSKVIARYSTRSYRNNVAAREVQYFITVAMMEIGFAITIVPAFIVILIDNLNPAIPYTEIAPAYAGCFYAAMSNSLVNVIVYSIRDPKFRSNVADIFASCCPTCCGRDVDNFRIKTDRTHKVPSPLNFITPVSPSTTSEFYSKSGKKVSESKA